MVLPVLHQHPLPQRALGTGCCPKGWLLLLRSLLSLCLSVLLAGSAGDTGLAVLARRVHRWGTWGRARGLFMGGSRQFEYMSRSGFNYSNWLSEGHAGACSGSEGERERLRRLMLRAQRSPCPHLAICPQPRGTSPRACGDTARARCTHVGACLSPAPNNLVVTAVVWEVKASGRVRPRQGCSGAPQIKGSP